MDNLEYRVTELEKEVKEVNKGIKLIMENHLPHLARDIQKVTTKIDMWSWFLGLIVSCLVALVIKVYAS